MRWSGGAATDDETEWGAAMPRGTSLDERRTMYWEVALTRMLSCLNLAPHPMGMPCRAHAHCALNSWMDHPRVPEAWAPMTLGAGSSRNLMQLAWAWRNAHPGVRRSAAGRARAIGHSTTSTGVARASPIACGTPSSITPYQCQLPWNSQTMVEAMPPVRCRNSGRCMCVALSLSMTSVSAAHVSTPEASDHRS